MTSHLLYHPPFPFSSSPLEERGEKHSKVEGERRFINQLGNWEGRGEILLPLNETGGGKCKSKISRGGKPTINCVGPMPPFPLCLPRTVQDVCSGQRERGNDKNMFCSETSVERIYRIFLRKKTK